MRPDLDDFEEMNQDAAAPPKSRAMSWLVLGVAVTGFAALAYYAYQSGTRSLGDGHILEVAAEPGDIKEEPADAGGEEFPHQDKTIYDALTGEEKPQKVEKLLPEPEEPVMPEPEVGHAEPAKEKTTTFINSDLAGKDGASATPAPEPVKKEEATAPAPVAVPAIPASTKEAPKTEPVAPEKVATPEKPKAAGNYKIQLGAFPSEAEAESEWKKIAKKHGGIVSGSPIILRVDDEKKGTFYRLRASGFATAAAAKAACTRLDAAGQPCFYAGK